MSKEDLLFGSFPNYLKASNIGELIDTVQKVIFSIGTPLAVLAIVYSGVMYITASGDSAKAANARKNLIWAITGLVVVLLAQTIVVWIPQALENKL